MKIHKLPEELVRRIAAGEVVERPASVLKELLENSLDAGAVSLTVEWRDAGRTLLRVTDDGGGMAPEDATLSLERHATSKITTYNDLERVKSFGFRGEALPSIASVSRFHLLTRAKTTTPAAAGWSIECEGGKILRAGPAGAAPGTTVTVKDLFYCTPARRKFLKSDATERGRLLGVVEDVSLSALGVHFTVIADGKTLFVLKPVSPDNLQRRLEELWGSERAGTLTRVHQAGRYLNLHGYVSDIHSSQASARYQRLYVNGRPIQHRRFTHALYEAYRGRLSVGRHPLAVLFLDIDPSAVDVNVHPAKREVRFANEEEVHGFLFRTLREALSGQAAMPSVTEPPHLYPPPRGGRIQEGVNSQFLQSVFDRPSSAESRAAYAFQSPPSSPVNHTSTKASPLLLGEGDISPLPLESFRQKTFRILAQFNTTYILTQCEDQFFIFDQHAAAERSLYEKLSETSRNTHPHRQTLLLPWMWETSASAAPVLQEHLANFEKMGYGLEGFGPQSFRVTAVPGVLGDSSKVKQLLEGLLDDLMNESIPRGFEALLVRAACRGSVKAGDALETSEMDKIIKDLKLCQSPWSCPHGRPTFLRLSADELAKRFRRT